MGGDEGGFGDEPAPDEGGFGDEPEADDKPFDDEPFDAGVEADEESDPKNFIEQLSGKLGQSLRKYSEEQGQPDFDLEKFAVNSVISATHTSEMDPQDQDDIIDKIKESGNDEEGHEEGGEMTQIDEPEPDMGGEEEEEPPMNNFGDEEEEEVEENIFEKKEDFMLLNPKKSSIFAPEGSEEAKFKHNIAERLRETFNQEETIDMEEPLVAPQPETKPITKPDTAPVRKPSRRKRTFSPSPNVTPDPKMKASN